LQPEEEFPVAIASGDGAFDLANQCNVGQVLPDELENFGQRSLPMLVGADHTSVAVSDWAGDLELRFDQANQDASGFQSIPCRPESPAQGDERKVHDDPVVGREG